MKTQYDFNRELYGEDKTHASTDTFPQQICSSKFDHWDKTEMSQEEARAWFKSELEVPDGRRCSPTCPQCQAVEWAIKALSVRWHKYPDEKPPESGDYLVSEYSCITRKISFVWVEEWDGNQWVDPENLDEGSDEPLVIERWVYAWMPLPEPMPKEKTDETN